MIGIENIGIYIPKERASNYELKEKFSMDNSFIEDKIGVKNVSRKAENEDTSDLAVLAFENLEKKTSIDRSEIECLIVVTQNPDYNLPHTSAIVHGKLGLPEPCACFDVSLGCSGYTYGLSLAIGFMKENDLNKGILITSDPYSKIINYNDKNTSILFGDGATATLISNTPVFTTGKFSFGTIGSKFKNLICKNQTLEMNGRQIYNFAAKKVPTDTRLVLEKNNIQIDEIDTFIFHQGSKYIVDTIQKRLNIDKEKVPFKINDYGNTVSSSIPILLNEYIDNKNANNLLLSGFGVGLSWCSCTIKRIKK